MLKNRIREAKRELDRTLRRNLRNAGKIWRDEAETLVSHPGQGTPSLPGEPPARQRGDLAGSHLFRVRKDKSGQLGAELGSEKWWARLFDTGTEKMAPRPYVIPALRRKQREIQDALSEPASR